MKGILLETIQHREKIGKMIFLLDVLNCNSIPIILARKYENLYRKERKKLGMKNVL